MTAALEAWRVGRPADDASIGVVALHASQLGGSAVPFHEVMREPSLPRAMVVDVTVPPFRGHRFLEVLSWLVRERLAAAGAEVTWRVRKQQAPATVQRRLEGLGWVLTSRRERAGAALTGPAPLPGAPPLVPRTIEIDLGGRPARVEADYGVFSGDQLDDGSRLLLEALLERDPVTAVADIGVGYGPLALGLTQHTLATEVVATDVDAIALWLADRNLRAHGVVAELRCSPSPTDVTSTPLTICNVPTHVDAASSRQLMGGLRDRAEHGALVVVVHRTLEQRYASQLPAAAWRRWRRESATHVVLGVDAPSGH